MRPTKDIKQLVADARDGHKIGSAKLKKYDSTANFNSEENTTVNIMNGADIIRKKTGGATYGNKMELNSSFGLNDSAAAAHKMKVLSDIDKDTIQAQSKKMQALRFENDQLKQKYSSLKRNFESISTYAKKDKEESDKILAMRTQYET